MEVSAQEVHMSKLIELTRCKVGIFCPICHTPVSNNLGHHIRDTHGEWDFKQIVLRAKEDGMSDPKIGSLFGINFKQLERIITEAYGINISVLEKSKAVKSWAPKNFVDETTTTWSFKQRGNWATHSGKYRGNWSPYIPRNIILKYSKPGDVVLDYFVGGGTTAVEAKLLSRRCIASDINPACIKLTLENLSFDPPNFLFKEFSVYEPEVFVADARNLSHVPDNSIDLICAHPPYAGIINYSSEIEGDLSKLRLDDFLTEMKNVAEESYRVLKPEGKCAILIGDTRKQKHVIPIGFQTINVFLESKFRLKELVIKRQHNCKTTGFWYTNSIKNNFLLLAHEYLPIFEKPKILEPSLLIKEGMPGYGEVSSKLKKLSLKRNLQELETTTVWLLPREDFDKRLHKNIIDRYSGGSGYLTVDCVSHSEDENRFHEQQRQKTKGLLFIKSSFLSDNPLRLDIESYLRKMQIIIERELPRIIKGGFLVIQTQDTRINGYIEPLAKRIVDSITSDDLWLKEIVVVTQTDKGQDSAKDMPLTGGLRITHQYLVIYEKVSQENRGAKKTTIEGEQEKAKMDGMQDARYVKHD
jgi:DNA modification methylase